MISNTFNKDTFISSSVNVGTYNVNPLTEMLKLHEDKISLYERMLKDKDSKYFTELRKPRKFIA